MWIQPYAPAKEEEGTEDKKKKEIYIAQAIPCVMPLSEHMPGVSINSDSASVPARLNVGILSYYMAPKRTPTTSSGARLKQQWSVLTLQEKLVVLGLLRLYCGLKRGTRVWPQHYIHYYTVYKKAWTLWVICGIFKSNSDHRRFTYRLYNVTPLYNSIPLYITLFYVKKLHIVNTAVFNFYVMIWAMKLVSMANICVILIFIVNLFQDIPANRQNN
jgi:hypothetical protein